MSAWTEERIAALKKFYTEGHSHSQIAKKLNSGAFAQLPTVSRNACLGKAHRLGIVTGDRTASRPVRRPGRLAMPRPVESYNGQPEDRLDFEILGLLDDGAMPIDIATAYPERGLETILELRKAAA